MLGSDQPLSRDYFETKLHVSREDVKYHLRDKQHGLISKGIVRERQGRVFLSLRSNEAAYEAASILCAKKWFLNALEKSFTESYMSGFGEFLSIGDRGFLNAGYEEVKSLYHLQNAVFSNLVQNGSRVNATEEMIEVSKALSHAEGHSDYMLSYVAATKYMYDVARGLSIDKISMDSLLMETVPRESMRDFIDWINGMYKKDNRNLLLEVIEETYRRGILEELNTGSGQSTLGDVLESEKILAVLVHKFATIKKLKITSAARVIGTQRITKDDFPLGLQEKEYIVNGIRGTIFYEQEEP